MIFYFITTETREKHRTYMQEYFEKLAMVCGEIALDNYDTQNAHYVVCVHPKYGVIGGLRLLSTMGPKLSDESLMGSGVALQDDETWEASKLFFYLPSDDRIQNLPEEFDRLCESFYSGLWEFLQSVCKIEMLVTLLPEEEHQDASHFGQWPFVLESPVSNPFDHDAEEYILGVLKIFEEDELPLAS